VASHRLLPVVVGHRFDLVLYRLCNRFLFPSPDVRTHATSMRMMSSIGALGEGKRLTRSRVLGCMRAHTHRAPARPCAYLAMQHVSARAQHLRSRSSTLSLKCASATHGARGRNGAREPADPSNIRVHTHTRGACRDDDLGRAVRDVGNGHLPAHVCRQPAQRLMEQGPV